MWLKKLLGFSLVNSMALPRTDGNELNPTEFLEKIKKLYSQFLF